MAKKHMVNEAGNDEAESEGGRSGTPPHRHTDAAAAPSSGGRLQYTDPPRLIPPHYARLPHRGAFEAARRL